MILVTGSTGLVGAHLLYKLASTNEKVRRTAAIAKVSSEKVIRVMREKSSG